MRNLKRLGAVAIAIALLAAVPTMAADMTVGQFVQQLARAKNLDATDGQTAADALGASGMRLPSGLNLDAPLTEGDVAAIARTAGLNVRTANPDARFDAAKSARFFSSFSGELKAANGDFRSRQFRTKGGGDESDGEDEDPGDGKGKGKGKNDRTPTEPD